MPEDFTIPENTKPDLRITWREPDHQFNGRELPYYDSKTVPPAKDWDVVFEHLPGQCLYYYDGDRFNVSGWKLGYIIEAQKGEWPYAVVRLEDAIQYRDPMGRKLQFREARVLELDRIRLLPSEKNSEEPEPT